MGIFELNLTMVVLFLLLAIIPSELYVFGHIFGRSKSYRKALPSRCSSQLELSGTLSPISGLFYSGGGEKIHFQAQSACNFPFVTYSRICPRSFVEGCVPPTLAVVTGVAIGLAPALAVERR